MIGLHTEPFNLTFYPLTIAWEAERIQGRFGQVCTCNIAVQVNVVMKVFSGIHLSYTSHAHTHTHTCTHAHTHTHTHTHMYRAISLEPTLSDAYWHRHALFLLQSNEKVYTTVHSQIVQFSANSTMLLPNLIA